MRLQNILPLTTLTLLILPLGLRAQATGPDLVIKDLYDTKLWGQVDDITAYSIGTEICNLGDENANWVSNTNRHPVIAQNMYRLKDGRFEQVGMSWLKHGFFAVNGSACANCDDPGTGDRLGPGCSDPYSASLNGDQDGNSAGGLGPRSEVDAARGRFPYPYGSQGQSGDAIYKRLQVHTVDVDPVLNPAAIYFIEGHYVTRDDALADNKNNNAGYREVGINGDLTLSLQGQTQAEAAIRAWQAEDPEVEIVDVDVAGDGRFTVGARATALEAGMWRYEYAVYNMNSHRSARGFSVPLPAGATVTNIGFHDVDYHSGEPYAGTDWTVSSPARGGAGEMRWETSTFDADPNANALRWGTLYNFRFDADAPPGPVEATLDLFRPGTDPSISAMTVGPNPTLSCGGEFTLGLSQTPLIRGEVAEITATGAAPGEKVTFMVSPHGEGCGFCPGQLGGLCLDIAAPVRRVGTVTADAGGTATLLYPVSSGFPFSELSSQATVRRGPGGADSLKSLPITAPILDP